MTKVLSRYKKQELLEDVSNLLGLEQRRVPLDELRARSKKTKRELVSSMVKECLQMSISDTDMLDLELQCELKTVHLNAYPYFVAPPLISGNG